METYPVILGVEFENAACRYIKFHTNGYLNPERPIAHLVECTPRALPFAQAITPSILRQGCSGCEQKKSITCSASKSVPQDVYASRSHGSMYISTNGYSYGMITFDRSNILAA